MSGARTRRWCFFPEWMLQEVREQAAGKVSLPPGRRPVPEARRPGA